MRNAFQMRRDLIVERLSQIPGVKIPDIGGAFYAFIDIHASLGRPHGPPDSVIWCEQLLEKEHVATVAGSAFGAEGHVRMSFAASEEKLTQGLDRIARFLSTIQ
jgi:aspartate aminotransferase